jgi:enoyl-CoA hydratase/carnithine racemase
MDSDGTVLAGMDGTVMTITLNRPDHGNAWNGAMTARYFALLEEAARSSEVRAIVVTGAGKAFCVGGDGGKLESAAAEGVASRSVQLPYWLPLRIGKPIIAAINGAMVRLRRFRVPGPRRTGRSAYTARGRRA